MVRISELEILELLRKNARMSFVEMSKKLGVTEAAVRKKIKRMEKEGIILGYTVFANPKKIGYEIDALIGIDTTPEKMMSVMRILKKNSDVINMYASSGDHMLMIECWFKNHDELAKFINYLENLDGVTRVCPATILEKLK